MMDQIIDNEIKPVTNPKEAIDQFVGEQFIEWLFNFVTHEIRSWEQLQQLRGKRFEAGKLRKFMLQRFIAAQAVVGREGEPGFLGFAIANLSESDDPEAESVLEILEKKLQEELEGGGSSRNVKKDFQLELWVKLLKALGASDDEINKTEPKEWTRSYIAELSDLFSNGEWQEVAGAFASGERVIPEENQIIAEVVANSAEVSPADLEALNWQAGVDLKYMVNTGHILEKIVFDKDSKELVYQGVLKHLEIRKEFINSLTQHLEQA